MRKNGESPTETDLPTLLGEIGEDTQKLLRQQIDLLRGELLTELQRAQSAAVSLSAGVGLVATGGILSTHMLVHLLRKTTRLPLWGCYGIVGGLLGVVGTKLIHSGSKGIAGLRPFSLPQSAEALKENLAWLKEQATID